MRNGEAPEKYQPGSLPNIFGLVERLHKRLKHIQRRTVSHTGLTPAQYAALSLLWERDERSLKELAVGIHCTQATMTTIVDGLERKGLVSREPNAEDRRSLLVGLTPEGAQLQESTPDLDEMFDGCCSGLSPDDSKTLAGLLTRLDESLSDGEPKDRA